MPQVVVTAQVEDLEKWENGFRTHGDLFRGQTITTPIGIAMTGNNEIAASFHQEDLDTFLKVLGSADTHEAMAADDIKRDTVKVYVFDKEFVP